ncbi:hypothetical protein MOE37_18605 [Bacillus atrophaeus]|uniref:hypothetical protein n=1 Tax=Bacillus atrophaeus TaxID=1452 RepID=UPI0022824AD6|nr:hypothetical protein [Bacillus atrophaeus]MCY8973557.1 hypothetical protein [Bacillus atrophaeus]
MNKDVNSIIKEVAERYGLTYDENKTEHAIISPDGSVKTIDDAEFFKAIGFPKRIETKWASVPGNNRVQWSNYKAINYVLSDESYEYKVKNEKIVA